MVRNLDTFDVCIVGGSIAGNYLCYLLSKTNLKILVIEEHEEIGLPFQCAGIVSQKLSKLIDFPKEIILNRVNIAKIIAPSGQYIKLSGDEEPYIIDRIALDRFFYENVKNKRNIKYSMGEKFKSFRFVKEYQNKVLLIETSKRKLKAKILIGCDGPLSVVGKLLRIKNRVIYASQIRIKGNFNQNEAVMYFDPRWKELFGWIVPEGNSIFRIGLASSKNIAKNFNIFIKQLNIDLNNKIDQQGGLIPSGTMNRLAFDNVLLLGDSACQVKATTGGGIIMLLTAAKYAAYCIQKCFEIKKFSKKIIKKYYGSPCKYKIGKELRVHYLIRAVLKKFRNDNFIELFRIIKSSKIEDMISIYGDMDFPKSLILKLITNPRIIQFLLRLLLKNPKTIVKLIKIYTK